MDSVYYVGFDVHKKTIVACVVIAVLAFQIWFFFFSGSPIG